MNEIEKKYNAIIKASPDIIATTDLEGHVLTVSSGGLKLLGVSSEKDLNGKSITDFVLPEDKERALNSIALMFKGEMVGLGEYTIVRPDGSTFYVESNAEFIRDENDKPYQIIFIIRDITKRKTMENKILGDNKILDLTGEIAKIGGWEVDLLDNKLYWTNQVYKIHEVPDGYTPTVESGEDFYIGESKDKIKKGVEDAINLGTSFDLELQIKTAKDNTLWVRALGKALKDENNKVVKVFGTFQDITDKKSIRLELEKQNILLQSKINELETFNKITVNREIAMIELKNKILDLEDKLKEK